MSKPCVECAPRLETERLILRAHRLEDFPACAAMWSDPTVAKYTIGSAASPQLTWRRLLAYCGHWHLLGFGYWAVESKQTGHFIGELGFADFHREQWPTLVGIPEIGWALAVEAHRQGYATEALRKVVEWGDAHLRGRRTVCIVHRENTPSIRLARKLGYLTELRAPTDDDPDFLLSRDLTRSET
ncbi:MAG TPA: GNAT family N-acetyltransferase [Steroidobacteraceae bacterium]|nr:GNAT family N-acetyltransferase [Steroidobacteraceae bacterium]